MTQINKILEERGKTNGDYALMAFKSVDLKKTINVGADRYSPEQNEALAMICHKLSRIAVGDPNHKDHWDDIAGYATLASQSISSSQSQGPERESS